MNTLFRLGAVLFCLALPACAQRPLGSAATAGAPAQQPEAPAHPAVKPDTRIHLDVIVADKAGNPATGLGQESFTVLDNKQPQKLTAFREVSGPGAAAEPLTHIILLIDEVNTSFSAVSYERTEIKKFLQQNGGHLPQPVSLVFFSDTGTQVQTDASQDGESLIASLDNNQTALRTIRRSTGFYGATDRLSLSLRTLQGVANFETTRPGRKLLIWVSPGWPILSGPNVQLSRKDQEGLMSSIVNLSTVLRQARITLSSVDPLGTSDAGGFRTSYYKEFLKGVSRTQDVQAGNLALEVLATQSGGRVLNSGNDITAEIARCASDANAFYALTIEAPSGEAPNTYHALEVKIDKPGLVARTRSGYYTQP